MVGSRLTEGLFIERQGVFTLLDALEHAPAEQQHLALGALSDLCDNATAVEHVRHWRSKAADRFDATRLLLRMWRAEQARLRVPLAEDGILAGMAYCTATNTCFMFELRFHRAPGVELCACASSRWGECGHCRCLLRLTVPNCDPHPRTGLAEHAG